MWEHAKTMTEAMPMHSSCQFFAGIQHILPRFGRFQSSFGEKTPMYMHSADCHSLLLLLGQEGGRLPSQGNLPVEPSQHVASPKKMILRKN